MERANEPPISSEEAKSAEGLPPELLVMPWRDEVIETLGFGPRSMYVEVCWSGVLGPTATLLYRRLGSWAEFNPDGSDVDLTDLAVSLGLGEGLGKNSLIAKAIGRLVHFDIARWAGVAELQVRQALPPLPLRRVERLSYTARRLHEEYTRYPSGASRGRMA
jgi:hypothetical protein